MYAYVEIYIYLHTYVYHTVFLAWATSDSSADVRDASGDFAEYCVYIYICMHIHTNILVYTYTYIHTYIHHAVCPARATSYCNGDVRETSGEDAEYYVNIYIYMYMYAYS